MTPTIKERKQNLKTLNNLLEQEKKSICTALFYDLHKPDFESLYMEIKQVQHEIQYHLDNLEDWVSKSVFINPTEKLTLNQNHAVKR